MTEVKRMRREDAVMVAIDYQSKIMPAMYNPEELTEKAVRFITGLKALNIPMIVTQQYTKGLGETIEPIANALGDFNPIEKNTFSACGCQEFMDELEKTGRKTVLMIGIEGHVCVEQTTLDLIAKGYTVFLITDCIQSRDKKNTKIARERMIQSGAIVTNYESALYEMLETSKAPEFKAISAAVK